MELADKHELFNNTLHPYSQALMNAIPVPDPTAPRKKAMLTGEPPSPINTPPGCPFHVRCPHAKDICAAEVPQLMDVGNGHLVACHLCQKGELKNA